MGTDSRRCRHPAAALRAAAGHPTLPATPLMLPIQLGPRRQARATIVKREEGREREGGRGREGGWEDGREGGWEGGWEGGRE